MQNTACDPYAYRRMSAITISTGPVLHHLCRCHPPTLNSMSPPSWLIIFPDVNVCLSRSSSCAVPWPQFCVIILLQAFRRMPVLGAKRRVCHLPARAALFIRSSDISGNSCFHCSMAHCQEPLRSRVVANKIAASAFQSGKRPSCGWFITVLSGPNMNTVYRRRLNLDYPDCFSHRQKSCCIWRPMEECQSLCNDRRARFLCQTDHISHASKMGFNIFIPQLCPTPTQSGASLKSNSPSRCADTCRARKAVQRGTYYISLSYGMI